MTGTDVLTAHAREAPDRIAVIVDDSGGARPSVTSFAELDAAVNRLAHGQIGRAHV